jgi:hypothetical protein
MQTVMFVLAAAVVADGLRGPRMAPMNLAGVLPWIHWRGLVVLGLLAVGNLFCMACPFMLPRTMARRFLHPHWRWPAMLRSKWMAAGLVALYLWAYEAFSLWDRAGVTAWIIVGYFVAAFVIDGLFRGASFCKYVCPIGQFNFINSLVSPYEVKVREPEVCQSCHTFDCIRGNEKQRGCELYLFQPKKATNLDCTFCLDCIHACPHDNVGLLPSNPTKTLMTDSYLSSLGRLSKRRDIAALALVIVFGAFANAFAMTGTFTTIEGRLSGALVLLAAIILSRRSSFSLALVPLGAAMWAAHLIFHLSTGLLTIVPVMERVLHSASPDWTLAAHPLFANSIAPFQFILLDAGLMMTLYVAWRVARSGESKSALGMFLPWGSIAVALYAAGMWILLQPMQMRGMMMN